MQIGYEKQTTQPRNEYYVPGIKTTLWLELEVGREQRVKERLSKGASKRGGEMDHDDFHYFLPRIDYKVIDQMATPQGGGRQQLSPQSWKNGYSGFNSMFKSLGILAKLDNENVEKFSAQDSLQVAKSLAAYIRMDGLLMKRSPFGDNPGRRPGLTFGELRNEVSVVSEGNETVYEERQHVEDFAKEVLAAYGYTPQEIELLFFSTEFHDATESAKERYYPLV